MKRIVSVLLVVCVLTSMISVGIVTSSASTISSSDDYYTYKESYIKNYCSYDYLVNEMRLPYRTFVETLDKDTAFQVELDAWKLATISPDSLATEITQTQQCKYYEAILIDLLVRNTQEESFIENVQSFKDSIHVSAWKKYVDYNSNILIDTPITSENADAILKEIKSMGNFGKALEYADTISDYIDYAVDISDLFDKLSKLEMIAQISESYAEVLNIMSSKCGNNVYLNTAIDNVALVFSKDLTVEQIKSIFIAKSAPYVVFEEFMKEAKKQVISYLGMAGLAIDLAQSVGTVVANSWFGTEDMINDYYEMSSLYEIEDLLRTAVLNTNGSTFCAAFKMYENICLMGCDYSKKYVEPLYTSLFGKLFAWATNQNYENYSAQLDDLKKQLSFMFEMIDVGANSWYVIDTGNTENMNIVNESFTIIQYTKEDYNNQNKDIKLDAYSTYGSNRGYDITLTKDMVINNNFVATSGTIDLNGHTLTINGNLLQPSGQMYIDGGTLEVNGDYRIQSYEKNSVTDEMEYVSSSGYLVMEKSKDIVEIAGDFIIQSNAVDRRSGPIGYYNVSKNVFKYGTMKVGGDFKQINGTNGTYGDSSNNYTCSEDHTVIFNGTQPQHIYFESLDSNFNKLVVTNNNLVWSGKMNITTLCSDMTVDSNNLSIYKIDLNGKKAVINNDVSMDTYSTYPAEIDLNKGYFIINGNLLQPSGQMYIDGGTLEVNGDYRIQSYEKNSVTDEMEYVSSSGYLVMEKSKDIVEIAGDFIIQSNAVDRRSGPIGYYNVSKNVFKYGTMKVGGDFKQINGTNGTYGDSSNNYTCSEDHTVIFNGTQPQHIYFESLDSNFNKLVVTNNNLVWSGKMNITTLCSDMTVDSNNLSIYKIDLNGKKAVINNDVSMDTYSTYPAEIDLNKGYFIINGNLLQPSGQMYIDGETLEVNGDYRIQSYEKNSVTDEMEYTNSSGYLNMSKANDFVKINGSFYTQSICGETDRIYSQPRNLLSAGTMEISGDFKQITGVDAGNYYAKTSNNFACKDTHTVILNGNNIQTVHFDNTNSYFNNLKLIKDKEKGYIFDQDNCWNKLYLNTNVESVVLTSTKNSLKQGESMQLVSNVMGINLPSQEVIWTISGNTDSNTTISDKGILSVSLNEKAKQITVTVTSVADNTKSASLTITIEEIVPVINGIAITPSVASTACGQSCQFNAVVFGFYNPSQSVIWSISGNKSSNTKIDSNGLLTIANNETSKQITVKAVSSADKTITASVTVDIMQIKITSTVDNVTVTMETGETQHLKAVVTGTNNPSQNVVWSVSGNNSENTVISDSGEITIGKDETSALIIVKAVSAEDSSKYGEFAISVKQNILIGDTNGDGNVTIADATELQKHLANIVDFNDEQLAVADTNGDGSVSIADATQIQRYLAQLIPSLG